MPVSVRPRRRRRPWKLATVNKACRAAAAVYMALEDLAAPRGGRICTPTRASVSALTGIKRLRTISSALKVLHNAHWIDLHKVQKNEGREYVTLLRIFLNGRGQKMTLTKHTSVGVKKRPTSRGQKMTHDFSYKERKEGATSPGLLGGPGGVAQKKRSTRTEYKPTRAHEYEAMTATDLRIEARALGDLYGRLLNAREEAGARAKDKERKWVLGLALRKEREKGKGTGADA